jgi:hypothetical protein
MRRSIASLALLALVLGIVALPTAAAARRGHNGWTLLGERRVTDKLDHDTIVVTAGRGDFRRIELRVLERPVQFHKVVVHFGNGEHQELDAARGHRGRRPLARHRPRGHDRVIHSIDFWYNAQSLRQGAHRARVFGNYSEAIAQPRVPESLRPVTCPTGPVILEPQCGAISTPAPR